MTTSRIPNTTAAGLRRLADLLDERPDLLDTGYLGLSIHPGPERVNVWADALRDAAINFHDRNDDHSRAVYSAQLADLRIVAVHDEPFRRYLREQEYVAAHRAVIHGDASSAVPAEAVR